MPAVLRLLGAPIGGVGGVCLHWLFLRFGNERASGRLGMPHRMQLSIARCSRSSNLLDSVHPNDPADSHMVILELWGEKLRKSQSLVTKYFATAGIG